jgi:hypothetical protein
MTRVLVLALLASGCALNPRPTAPSTSTPDLTGVMKLFGRFSSAHACPVGERMAVTNAHVSDLRPFDRDFPLYPFRWSDDSGHSGVVDSTLVERSSDLAILVPVDEETFPRYYKVAQTAPAVGDRVWFLGYSWKTAKEAYSTRVITGTILRIVADHIVISEAGEPGSSGSCVLNANGEVVAINAWRTEIGTDAVGIAVGVWPK